VQLAVLVQQVEVAQLVVLVQKVEVAQMVQQVSLEQLVQWVELAKLVQPVQLAWKIWQQYFQDQAGLATFQTKTSHPSVQQAQLVEPV
jgi:hypothetical protein